MVANSVTRPIPPREPSMLYNPPKVGGQDWPFRIGIFSDADELGLPYAFASHFAPEQLIPSLQSPQPFQAFRTA